MFYGEKVVWLLYRRFLCRACKGTMARIDPRFINQLYRVVTQRFHFVTTASGLGTNERMVLSFVKLSTNNVLFGTCVDLINNLCSVKHHSNMLSHYDCAHDIKTKSIFTSNTLPTPFPKFASPGECNGIKLTKRLLKNIFISFMTVCEPCMQKSFQFCHDNGASRDHTHKCSKLIKATNRNRNVFTASCATMNLIEKVTISHLTFTKSNA